MHIHTKSIFASCLLVLPGSNLYAQAKQQKDPTRPNIVIIYADDLGYGDVSCYGATKIKTPNIDRLAQQGLKFSNVHASSAQCTPSRYSLLTGQYAWRVKGTNIAPGNAASIIPTDCNTLPDMLQKANYTTGVVGKWHLGLGSAAEGGPDWNGTIKPGPKELGFDYSFLIPATGDRVPCVFVENSHVVGIDPADPIQVSYGKPIGNEPTGKEHPELLKMQSSNGHNNTIIDGIGRIGYMTGGHSARWTDENIADQLTSKAKGFIVSNKAKPFFLYFAPHDIHVPHVPNQRFVGKSNLGVRGDAILQLDWTVGEIMKTLDSLHISENTLVIFSSDNGPVVDDGYRDFSVENLNGHTPAGPLRGGKYSAYDGGTRVPFIIKWPKQVKANTSSAALISQLDLFASFAQLTGQKLAGNDAPDSFNELSALLGKTTKAREYVIEHAVNGTLSIIKGSWKYIEPAKGKNHDNATNIDMGNEPVPQLFNLDNDLGEKVNVAEKNPEKTVELAALLKKVRETPKTRP
jgi:arylsulfatase A-like enzyme